MATHDVLVANRPYPLRIVRGNGYIGITVLGAVAAACGLALAGRLDATPCATIVLLSCVAGIVGACMPRVLLTLLFTTAPLLWALGETNIVESDKLHLNLPMLVGFLVVVAFVHLLFIKSSDAGIEWVRVLSLGMGVVCVPAIFAARDLFTGAGGYLRIMCPYVVMFATLRHVRSRSDVLRYARCMAGGLVAVAAVLLIAYWRSELWVEFGGYTRLSALNYQTQGFGIFLSVMVFVVLLNYRLTGNWCYLLGVAFPLVALYLTYDRTAWVGAAVLIILLILQLKKSYGRRLLWGGAILSVIVLPVVWQSFLRYDTTIDSWAVLDSVLSGRLSNDAIAVASYLESPTFNKITGIGFFRSKEATGLALGQEFTIHDDYLALSVETGVCAMLFYVAILITLLKRCRQGRRYARERISYIVCGAASGLIIAVLVMGVAGAFYTEVLSNFYVYGIMGMMLTQSSVVISDWRANVEHRATVG